MMTGHEGWFGFGGGFMWLIWIFIIIAIIWGIKMTIGNGASGSSSPDSPLEILKKRYARGEIDEEEFNHRRQELEK
jgi:putative membrane protein